MNTTLSPQGPEKYPARGGNRWVPALLVGILLGAAALALLSRQADSSLWGRLFGVLLGRSTRVDVSQPTVVNKIQQLQRLETVVYTVDKVVSGEKENVILPDFLAGDRLLMLVHGEVVAGVDFSGLNSGDVSVNGRQVRLHLPYAQVFSTRIDSARTRVYSRQTGLLVPVDPNLESQVRQEAERQLLQAAVVDGILKTAQQNARTTLTSLLQGLGFGSVEFY
ncbi:MAG TPA: DUF4230 domain-containing protein [Terriglobales bacterium]|nr:DUF4230 domain-containing protein [Terriglobales bacterium]